METSVYLQVNTLQTVQAQTSLCYPSVVSCHKECGFVLCCRNFLDDNIKSLPSHSPGRGTNYGKR